MGIFSGYHVGQGWEARGEENREARERREWRQKVEAFAAILSTSGEPPHGGPLSGGWGDSKG